MTAPNSGGKGRAAPEEEGMAGPTRAGVGGSDGGKDGTRYGEGTVLSDEGQQGDEKSKCGEMGRGSAPTRGEGEGDDRLRRTANTMTRMMTNHTAYARPPSKRQRRGMEAATDTDKRKERGTQGEEEAEEDTGRRANSGSPKGQEGAPAKENAGQGRQGQEKATTAAEESPPSPARSTEDPGRIMKELHMTDGRTQQGISILCDSMDLGFRFTGRNRGRALTVEAEITPTPHDEAGTACKENQAMCVECGEGCRNNNKLGRGNWDRFRVEDDGERGLGLSADKHYEKDDIICEYTGEIREITDLDPNRTYRYALRMGAPLQHLVVDAERWGSPARFAQHVCADATARFEQWTVRGHQVVGLVAEKEILPGEEITVTYRDGYNVTEQVLEERCLCGHARCSGVVGASARPDQNRGVRPVRRPREQGGKGRSVRRAMSNVITAMTMGLISPERGREARPTIDTGRDLPQDKPRGKDSVGLLTASWQQQGGGEQSGPPKRMGRTGEQNQQKEEDRNDETVKTITLADPEHARSSTEKQKCEEQGGGGERIIMGTQMDKGKKSARRNDTNTDKGPTHEGREVWKHFSNGWHKGTVTSYDKDEGLYWIQYTDGDCEEMTGSEVETHLDAPSPATARQERRKKDAKPTVTNKKLRATRADNRRRVMVFNSGVFSTREQHRRMWERLGNPTRQFRKEGGAGKAALYLCLAQAGPTQSRGKSALEIRRALIRDIEETRLWNETQYERQLGCSWQSWIDTVQEGAWPDALTMIHLSRWMRTVIEVWTPHSPEPTTYQWGGYKEKLILVWCNRQGQGCPDTWIAVTPHQTSEKGEAEEEGPHDTEDPWSGLPWTWKDAHQRETIRDITALGKQQWKDSSVVSECNSERLFLTVPSLAGTTRARTGGWGSLRQGEWISDDVISQIMHRYAKHGDYGLGGVNQPQGMEQIWMIDALGFHQLLRGAQLRHIPVATCRRVAGIVQVNGNHWITVVAEVQQREVHIIDSMGQGNSHRQVATKMILWLQGRGCQGPWTIRDGYNRRQYNASDCGIFALGDLLGRLEGRPELMEQTGARDMREYFATMLWAEGHQPLRLPDQQQALKPGDYRTGTYQGNGQAVHASEEGGRPKATARTGTPKPPPHQRGANPAGSGGSRVDSYEIGGWTEALAWAVTKRIEKEGRRSNQHKQTTLLQDHAGQFPRKKQPRKQGEEATHRAVEPQQTIRIGNWRVGVTPPHKGGVLICQNIGPSGMTGATEWVDQILREEPAVLFLADTRLPATKRAKTTKYLTSGPGARYLCWHGTAVERHTVEEDGKRRRKRFYTGVTTLIHKSVRPALAAMTLKEIGLETLTPIFEGRVLMNKVGEGVVINVYQHTAARTRQQRELLDAISRVCSKLRQRHQWVLVGGDFNAAVYGLDRERGERTHASDKSMKEWATHNNMERMPQTQTWTWHDTDGHATAIDHVFMWRAKTDSTAVQSTTEVREATAAMFDHCTLRTQLPGEILPAPRGETKKPRIALDFQNWEEEHGPRYKQIMTEVLREVDSSDPVEALQRVWTQARVVAETIAGREVWPGQTGGRGSRERRQLNKDIRDVKTALRETAAGTRQSHGIRSAWAAIQRREIEIYNELLRLASEEEDRRVGEHRRLLRTANQNLTRKLRTLIQEEGRAKMRALAEEKQKRFGEGGYNAIKKMFGKTTSPLDLWGVLSQQPHRRHVDTMHLTREGFDKWCEWTGEGIGQAIQQGWDSDRTTVYCSREGREGYVKASKAKDGVTLTVRPLSAVHDFLDATGVRPTLTSTTEQPDSRDDDKLCQLEAHFATEQADADLQCARCQSQTRPTPIATGGEVRRVRWWCNRCGLTTTRQPEPTNVQQFRHLMSNGGFWVDKGENEGMEEGTTERTEEERAPPFLQEPLGEEEFDFFCSRLPLRKAAGADGVCYEMIKWAPTALKTLILRAINAMLAGHPVPHAWHGGLIRLLGKREPVHEPENLRPVTLLHTTYKLFASVVNYRVQRQLERKGIITPSQNGSMHGRETYGSVIRVKYAIEEAKRTKQTIYVAYVDFYSAFCSISTSKLFCLLRQLGMAETDVLIFEGIYRGMWSKVNTTFGETAEIPLQRGSCQGCPLSPTTFIVFLDLCLRHLHATGPGMTFRAQYFSPTDGGADQVFANHGAFVDDVGLICHSAADMNSLLDRLHEFCEWAGMSLCVPKTEITAHNFGEGAKADVSVVQYGPEGNKQQLKALRPDVAFRYLGIRTALVGGTAGEKEYILKTVRERGKQLRGHQYTEQQANSAVRASVYPTVTYSSPLTSWTARDIFSLEQAMLGVRRAAWKFSKSHNTAQMILPTSRGGVVEHPMPVMMAKAAVSMVERIRNSNDPAALGLLRQEWVDLQTDWGTTSVWKVQLGLLLSDEAERIELPVANMLFICGLVGITPSWTWLGMDEPTRGNGDTDIVQTLEGYALQQVVTYWTQRTRQIRGSNRALARGLQTLMQKKKGLDALRHQQGGWSVDLPKAEQEQVLLALETTFPGTARTRIHFSPHKISEIRAVGIVQAEERPVAVEQREKGGKMPRKRRTSLQERTGLGNCNFKVHSYNHTTEEYTAGFRTGTIEGWQQIREADLVESMIGHVMWIPAGLPTTEGWEGDDSHYDGIPQRKGGWFFKYTQWRRKGNSFELSGYFIEQGGQGDVTYTATHPITTVTAHLAHLDTLPDTIVVTLREEELGAARRMLMTNMHPSIYHYWDTITERPHDVAIRLEQGRREPAAKQRKTVQKLLRKPDSTAPRMGTIERHVHRKEEHPGKVSVRLWPADQVNVEITETGIWHWGKGTIRLQSDTLGRHAMELATFMTWKERGKHTWQAMETLMTNSILESQRMEERGFRTPAWSIYEQISEQLDITVQVGLPETMAPPYPAKKVSGTGDVATMQFDGAIITLEAIPAKLHGQVLQRLETSSGWAVIGNTARLTEEVKAQLDLLGEGQDILPPNRERDDKGQWHKQRHPQTFGKGWWRTGSKTLCLTTKGGLRVWTSGRNNTGLQIIPPMKLSVIRESRRSAAVQQYLEWTPSGPYRHIPGQLIWTDGSKQTQDGQVQVGAGGVVRGRPDLHYGFQVGGPAKAIRGEMAAVAWAADPMTTPYTQPLTVVTDCRSLLDIVRRWRRNDFAPYPEAEHNWDILKDLLHHIRQRTAQTTIIWVKAHAGDVGNEEADKRASQGGASSVKRWDLTTEPLKLHRSGNGETVSSQGWNKGVSKAATEMYGNCVSTWLRVTSEAACTQSLTKTGRGRQHLGKLYTGRDDGVADWERRAFMQARAACYPTRAKLHQWGKATTAQCDLCGAERETYGHVQAHCRVLAEANCYRKAHDMVAGSILECVTRECDGIHTQRETPLGDYLGEAGCPPALRRLQPDAFLTREGEDRRKKIWVFEFQRGWTDHDKGDEWRAEAKNQKYGPVKQAIERASQEAVEVSIAVFVIGVLGSIREHEWMLQLQDMGMTTAAAERTCGAAVRELARANAMVLSARATRRFDMGKF